MNTAERIAVPSAPAHQEEPPSAREAGAYGPGLRHLPRRSRDQGAAKERATSRENEAPNVYNLHPHPPRLAGEVPAHPTEPISWSVTDLYDRYAPLVFRRACRFVHASEAEEVVHEIFLMLVERPHVYQGTSSPVTWFYRVTTNRCLNRLRNRGRRLQLLELRSPPPPRRSEVDQLERRIFLRRIWREISPHLVEIGVAHYVDGLTLKQVADVVGCSPRTVVNRLQALRRAVCALADGVE